MHQQKVVHLDLNTNNVVVGSHAMSLRLSVIDYGLSFMVAVEETTVEGYHWTRCWIGPEIGVPRTMCGRMIEYPLSRCIYGGTSVRERLHGIAKSLQDKDPRAWPSLDNRDLDGGPWTVRRSASEGLSPKSHKRQRRDK